MGTYQIGPASLYDMIKYHPNSALSKQLLEKFTLHKGYTVNSFYERTRRSEGYQGVIAREYRDLCQQISKMGEQDQQDIFDHKTDNWMKRYNLTHVDFFPAFLFSNLAPALAARLQQEWDNGKHSPETTLNKLLETTVFQGSSSDIGKYTKKAYWWNAHIDGAAVEYVKGKDGRTRLKPKTIGIDGKIDVRDVLNYYTRTLYPAVYTEVKDDLIQGDLSFHLTPLARGAYLKADEDFFNEFNRHLPLLNALRTACHHVEVYEQISKRKKRRVKPFALSAHLAGGAIDLKASELTSEQKNRAVTLLEEAGYTRPWKHKKGEEYHFELAGFENLALAEILIDDPVYASEIIRYASIQPPLAFDNKRTPYYLNRNVEISTSPFGGLVPTEKMGEYFNF